MRIGVRASWLFALGSCWLPNIGHAQPEASPAPPYGSLTWTRAWGAEQCPEGDVVERLVDRYLGYGAFSAPSERRVDAHVARTSTGWSASFRVLDPAGGVLASRTLHAQNDDCHSLAVSVAFTLALAADPSVATRPAPAESDVSALPEDAAASARTTPATPRVDSRPDPEADAPAMASFPAAASPRAPGRGAHISIDAARVGVLTTAGTLPHSGPGAEVGLSCELGLPFDLEVVGSLVPGRARNVNQGVRVETGLSQAWLGLHYPWAERGPWSAQLHAAVGAGALHVSVSTPQRSDPADVFVASVRAGPRLDYALARSVAVYCALDAAFALQRGRFSARGASAALWEQSPVGLFGSCGGAFLIAR